MEAKQKYRQYTWRLCQSMAFLLYSVPVSGAMSCFKSAAVLKEVVLYSNMHMRLGVMKSFALWWT
jgi:hypothetical protein